MGFYFDMKCKNTDCNNDVKKGRVYCSLRCRNIYVNLNLRDYSKVSNTLVEKLGVKHSYLENPKKCKQCGEVIPFEKRRNNFCNSSCSATHTNLHKPPPNDIQKYKISKKITELWNSGYYNNTTLVNHLSKSKKIFSSKNERYILNYFKTNYPEDEWTSGGLLKYKNELISRDMYSKKLKICFEYDGIWHFKDIFGQLSKKQHKDYLLEEWCKENGYRLIRVDEDDYINIKQLIHLIYHTDDTIVKIGKRYK